MSGASNVVPLRHRAATRFGPREARRLANIAVPRNGTSRDLLALLLRMCDPRRGYTDKFKHDFLAEELGVHLDTIRRSFRQLEHLDLVQVRPGGGHGATAVTLTADRLLALSLAKGLRNPLVNHPSHPHESPVHPPELADPQPPQLAGVTPADGGGNPRSLQASNAPAREGSCSSLAVPPNPPASRGAPGEVCPKHGAGCARRRCGRSPRQLEAEQRQRQADEQRAAEAAQWDARTRAAAQAAISPPTDLVNSARAAIHASKGKKPSPTKGTPDEN